MDDFMMIDMGKATSLKVLADLNPFQRRNAEEFKLEDLLDFFVSPSVDEEAFSYSNSIVKGQMGAGKSMFLRANLAFYQYAMVPSVLEGGELIVPVFIRLSDFQHLDSASEIYKEIILRIIKEIIETYSRLQDVDKMVAIHKGVRYLPKALFKASKLQGVLRDLVDLECEEFKQIMEDQTGASAKFSKFCEIGMELKSTKRKEILAKKTPGIGDLHDICDFLFDDIQGGILLLVDEAGSLNKNFFRGGRSTSLFEVLMNQLRTSSRIRAKVAVYPNSYSDVLAESRYGNYINLVENVRTETGYCNFREKVISIIDKYVSSLSDQKMRAEDMFVFDPNPSGSGDLIEQVVYASDGNVRRVMTILNGSLKQALKNGKNCVEASDVFEYLAEHARSSEEMFSEVDQAFLTEVAKVCKNRSTYRFKFPNKSPILTKFVNKSEEYNILKIVELGTGRKGTTYEFDYSYCIRRGIPTHSLKGSEKVCKSRSRIDGQWVKRIATVSDELLVHSNIQNKVEGEVSYWKSDKQHGFVQCPEGEEWFFSAQNIVDCEGVVVEGRKMRFVRWSNDGIKLALAVECL